MVKVVTPDWILDSIDAGQRQEETLYHPTCLRLKGSSHHAQTTRLSSPSSQRCNGETSIAAGSGAGEQDGDRGGEEKVETQPIHSTSGETLLVPFFEIIVWSKDMSRVWDIVRYGG